MASFPFEILTPSRKVYGAEVSEVVLPAYDGEVGVLPGHADFVGKLGTGPLKAVKDGEDYWFLISGGLWQVISGTLTIFTELAQNAQDVDIETAKLKVADLEGALKNPTTVAAEELPVLQAALQKEAARVEIHRRTNLVN